MKVFIDANVILDRYDIKRSSHKYSVQALEYLIQNGKLFTSCDLITTIYYINAKQNKQQALLNIQSINKIFKVIEFSNKEIEQTCDLMLKDRDYTDLEDTIQYILAQKLQCDLIISNDTNFTSKEIKCLTSEQFCKEYKLL